MSPKRRSTGRARTGATSLAARGLKVCTAVLISGKTKSHFLGRFVQSTRKSAGLLPPLFSNPELRTGRAPQYKDSLQVPVRIVQNVTNVRLISFPFMRITSTAVATVRMILVMMLLTIIMIIGRTMRRMIVIISG